MAGPFLRPSLSFNVSDLRLRSNTKAENKLAQYGVHDWGIWGSVEERIQAGGGVGQGSIMMYSTYRHISWTALSVKSLIGRREMAFLRRFRIDQIDGR